MKPLILALAVVAAAPVLAAEKQPVNKPLDAAFLRQYAETRGFMLGRPVKPKPSPDGKAVLFLRSEAKSPKQSLFEFDVATGKTKELLSPDTLMKGEETLTPEEKARRERMRQSSGGFTDFQFSDDGKLVLLSLSGKLYVLKRDGNAVRELKTGPGVIDPKFSPDAKLVAYVREHDVHAYDLATDKAWAVTKGGTLVKTHGLAEFVAQEEMGRMSGYWWSPDSKFIAYEEADHEGVEQWFVADPLKPDQKPLPQYYPRPGKRNVAVRLGIVPVAGGETVWVEWDRKKYEYLAAVQWHEFGPLTVQLQDRKQQELGLMLVNVGTGALRTLVKETDNAFVNLRRNGPFWFKNRTSFVWESQQYRGRRTQSAALELRSVPNGNDESDVRRTVGGEGWKGWILNELISVHRDGPSAVASISPADAQTSPTPTQNELWRFSIDNFDMAGLEPVEKAPRPGQRSAVLLSDHTVLVLTSTSADSMPRTSVLDAADRVVGELPSVAESPGVAPRIAFTKEGDFWTAIVRPQNFDPKRKYPVVNYVYGGPKHLTVVQAMRPWLLMQWLADQGFIVAAIDNRGTPGRGRDWEKAIYQKFGSVPLEDQVAGLKLLGAKHPEMDMDRVGVYGWSFGGYMSALSVLKRPDIFKAAVAGAPVADWEDYDTHYTERYMGLLPASKKAYEEASLLPLASKLERPLLLVHGTADDNVYFRHTLRLTDALFRAGKDFDVLPLPGQTHRVADPEATERLWTRIALHFKKHLGAPK